LLAHPEGADAIRWGGGVGAAAPMKRERKLSCEPNKTEIEHMGIPSALAFPVVPTGGTRICAKIFAPNLEPN
jgi:hypothetical protein